MVSLEALGLSAVLTFVVTAGQDSKMCFEMWSYPGKFLVSVFCFALKIYL